MTPCPMCGHDVEWTDHERGVLINAVASSGARLVALEAAYASAPGERKIELRKLVDQEKITLRALKERLENL